MAPTSRTPALQQFTVNMFADMGIQPGVADAILASQGLVRAVGTRPTRSRPQQRSTDIARQVPALSTVLITGTATDTNGTPPTTTDDGKVAVVEISFDGGATWKVANTTNNWATWSYNWQPKTQGTFTIQARAIDDSLNVANITPTADTVTVTAPIQPDTLSLFDPYVTVTGTPFNDGQPIELGMTFSASQAGQVTQLKYFRGASDANDTDVRDGHLWASNGTLLATATFTSGSGQSGWQVATLSAPVAIAAGTKYIVSYKTNNNYVATNSFFSPANEVAFDGVDDDAFSDPFGVLSAPQNDAVNRNGVYKYGTAAAVFPDQTYQGEHYWVDVSFTTTPSTTPIVTLAVTPSSVTEDGASNLVYTFTRSIVNSSALTVNYTVGGSATNGTDYSGIDTAGTTKTITFAANSATATVTVDPTADTTVEPNETVALTLATGSGYAVGTTAAVVGTITNDDGPSVTSSSLFTSKPVTGVLYNDATPVELGMKFTANQSGQITELKYYRDAADANDTDNRTGRLWSSSGAVLGSVTFNSTANQSGWQVAALSSPIAITAGQTYVVSYRTDNNYLAAGSFFAPANEVTFDGIQDNAFTDSFGFLSAPQSTVVSGGGVGGNGVYNYGTSVVLPNNTYNAANYWVDVTASTTSSTTPVITLAIAPASVPEDGTTNLVYTFTRSDVTISDLAVNYNVSGTATNGTDYTGDTLATSTVTFAGNSATATVIVDPTVDTTVETDETVALTLATGTAYTIGTATAVTGTITNDDIAPLPSITLAVATDAVAGRWHQTNLVYTFTRSDVTISDLAVNYNRQRHRHQRQRLHRDRYSWHDLKLSPSRANSATATVIVDPTVDTTVETDETVALTLATGTAYTIGTTTAVTGTITNDDVQNPDLGDAVFSISGTLAVNQILTVSKTADDPNGYPNGNGVFAYQWQSFTNGTDWSNIGSNAATYTTTLSEESKQVRVLVSYTDGAGYTESVIAPPVTIAITNLTLTGTSSANQLTGGSGNDSLSGLGGNDTLVGNGGNDTLNGGTGTDTMSGGEGDDTYVVNATTDVVTEQADQGTDTVNASVTYTLSANVENLVLTGTGNINGTGNTLNNTLTGNPGNNTLSGGNGDDILVGGAGRDTLTGSSDADVFRFSSLSDSLLFSPGTTTSARDRITDLAIGVDSIDGPNAVAATD